MTEDEILGCAREAAGLRLRHHRPAGRRGLRAHAATSSPTSCGASRPRPAWPSPSAWASAPRTTCAPGAKPAPTATCCASRPPTRTSTAASIRPAPAGAAESDPSDRLDLLRRLRELGYEIGSGVMVGIPGQTYEIVARDIELFRTLDLDMIGIGPYIPHPETPARRRRRAPAARARRPGAQRRTHGLQGRGAHPAGLPGGQHPQHHGAGHHQQGIRPRAGPAARREHRHAQPDAAASTGCSTRSIRTRPASTRRRRCAGSA